MFLARLLSVLRRHVPRFLAGNLTRDHRPFFFTVSLSRDVTGMLLTGLLQDGAVAVSDRNA